MSEKGRHALREKFRGLRKRTKIAIVGLLVVPLVAAGAVAANAVTADQVTPEGRIAAKWFDVCVSPDGRNPRFIMENQSCGGSSIHYRWAGSAHPKIQDGKSAYAQWAEAQGDADTSLTAYFEHIAAMAEGGAQGPQGDPGPSAYELAVAAGFEGTEAEWLASLKGDKGDKGDAGEAGAAGAPGADGQDGVVNPETDGTYHTLAEGDGSTVETFTVDCAEGKVATGGGFSIDFPQHRANVQFVGSTPANFTEIAGDPEGSVIASGWEVQVINNGPETSLRTWVACAEVNSGDTTE